MNSLVVYDCTHVLADNVQDNTKRDPLLETRESDTRIDVVWNDTTQPPPASAMQLDSDSDSEEENDMEEIYENQDTLLDDDPFGWILPNEELLYNKRRLNAEKTLGEYFKREASNIGA